MNKQQKAEVVNTLKDQFDNAEYFYLIDESTLTADATSKLRRAAFEKGISYKVIKNTLIKRALEASNKEGEELYSALKGPTAVFFSESANEIAKLIKDFRGEKEKPELKAAYIDSDVFIGDGELNNLASLKSKSELIGEIITLLGSPGKNVISALQSSGGGKISNLLTALENKEQ